MASDQMDIQEVLSSFSKFEKLESYLNEINNFIKLFSSENVRIALITSGPVSSAIEQLPVRYITNFSTGTRACKLARQLLRNNYAVIFIYSNNSHQPFLENLNIDNIQSDCVLTPTLKKDIEEYFKYKHRLLLIKFTLLDEYMNMLWYGVEYLDKILHENYKRKCLILLAAAVSDFFIPYELRDHHKMVTGDSEKVNFVLHKTPKLIPFLTSNFGENFFFISFKLETRDDDYLKKKMLDSMTNSKTHMVIGNLLQNRYDKVWILSKSNQESNPLYNKNDFIEVDLATFIVESHSDFIH